MNIKKINCLYIFTLVFTILSLLLILGCPAINEIVEKVYIEKEFIFPEFEMENSFVTISSGPWFQNFETGTAGNTYESGENCIAMIYDLSVDNDGIGNNMDDPTSDLCIKQDPSSLVYEDCNTGTRVATITPTPLNEASNDITYAVDAQIYSYLILNFFLPVNGYKNGAPHSKPYGDNFFIRIHSINGESQIWTNQLELYGNNDMPSGEWFKLTIDLSDAGWTGVAIDKSSIMRVFICEYDDYNLYIDSLYFADNTYDTIPVYE